MVEVGGSFAQAQPGFFKAGRRLSNGQLASEASSSWPGLLQSLAAAGEDRTRPVVISEGVMSG